MKNTFFQKDILSGGQFSKEDIALVMQTADNMKQIVKSKGSADLLQGKLMAALFYEPSSRTFGSFIASMQRLGGGIIPMNGMENASVAKGETLEDTVRIFSAYADVLVIRHPEVGSLGVAAQHASKPVINAGDGAFGEHPTQALIDLYTMKQFFGKIEGLNILIIGDLAHYRPTNSLVKALANYPKVTLNLATPAQVPLREEIRNYLKEKRVAFREYSDFEDLLPDTDVLYVTRVKKEYMSEDLYHQIKGSYVITKSLAERMKKKSIIMHCLPRIDEVSTDVDDDARAVYFKDQLQNGLYVRMALLSLILNK